MKKPQLFLLHFAGGNCYSLKFMAPLLRDFELVFLELPGRGQRMKEGLLKDFDEAARDICDQLVRKLNSPDFLIYGHSMGAYLALKVTGLLEKKELSPAYLIVSGNAGPGIRENEYIYLLGKDDFIEKLTNYGGLPKELLENRELFDFFEPILRADFELVANHGMTADAAVNVPLFAMMGSQEEDLEKISNWSVYTNSEFHFEVLEGNHFFIHQHPQQIANIIRTCYKLSVYQKG